VATTNRFEGKIISQGEIEESQIYGINAAKYQALRVSGRLSKTGLAADFDIGGEDLSSTGNFFCYKATAQSVINSMALEISLGTFTSSAACDTTLWLGGTAALTNGVIWGVGTVGTATPDLLYSTGAKSIAEFTSVHGAKLTRSLYSVDGSASADNHDSILVVYNFEDMFGFPIRLNKGQFIGVFGNDDFSSAKALTTFTGRVFGRLIFQ